MCAFWRGLRWLQYTTCAPDREKGGADGTPAWLPLSSGRRCQRLRFSRIRSVRSYGKRRRFLFGHGHGCLARFGLRRRRVHPARGDVPYLLQIAKAASLLLLSWVAKPRKERGIPARTRLTPTTQTPSDATTTPSRWPASLANSWRRARCSKPLSQRDSAQSRTWPAASLKTGRQKHSWTACSKTSSKADSKSASMPHSHAVFAPASPPPQRPKQHRKRHSHAQTARTRPANPPKPAMRPQATPDSSALPPQPQS